jgi:hypothetical protein
MPSSRSYWTCLAALIVVACAALLIGMPGCTSSETPSAADGKVKTNATTPGDDGAVTTTAKAKTTAPATQDQARTTQPVQQTSDKEAAVSAAKASARANNPSLGSLDVLDVKISGSWARVDLQPTDRSTDGASWLLKKSNGDWTVVEYGTSIMPSDHPEAPAELFQ